MFYLSVDDERRVSRCRDQHVEAEGETIRCKDPRRAGGASSAGARAFSYFSLVVLPFQIHQRFSTRTHQMLRSAGTGKWESSPF